MGAFSRWFRKEKISGYNGAIVPERDDLISEYPILGLGEGMYFASGAGSISGASLSMTVPSGKLFHLKYIDYQLNVAPAHPIILYDGPGESAPRFMFGCSATNQVYHVDGIFGAVFQSAPWMGPSISATAAYVKIGGIIRDRVSEV